MILNRKRAGTSVSFPERQRPGFRKEAPGVYEVLVFALFASCFFLAGCSPLYVLRAGYEEAIWLPHQLFLGERTDVEQIVEAIAKVREQSQALIGFEHPDIRAQGLSRGRRSEMEAERI